MSALYFCLLRQNNLINSLHLFFFYVILVVTDNNNRVFLKLG